MNELEKRMAGELGNFLCAQIEEHYFIPRTVKPKAQELPVAAKLTLWGAAVRDLVENRLYVDKAGEPETDPSEDIGSHAA
jgi:hypothetical protein